MESFAPPISAVLKNSKNKLKAQRDYRSMFILKGFNYKRWTPIPNELLADSRISSGAKCFWSLLQSLGDEKGHSYYGQKKLARFMDKKIRTIQRYQSQLIKYRWLVIEPGREYRSNNYYVVWLLGGINPKWTSYLKKQKNRR